MIRPVPSALHVSLSLAVFLLSVLGAAPTRASEFAFVVHRDNPTTNLTTQEVRDLYLGRRRFWEHGAPTKPVLPGRSSGGRALLFNLLETTPRAFGKHWTGVLYRNEAPERPASAEDKRAAEIVARAAGGIALLDVSAVPPGLKVLAFEGKRPGEEGYALREEESPPAAKIFAPALLTTLGYLGDVERFAAGLRILVVSTEETAAPGEELRGALAELIGVTQRQGLTVQSVELADLAVSGERLKDVDVVVVAPGLGQGAWERVAASARRAKVLSVCLESAGANAGLALALVRHGKRLESYVNRAATEGAGFSFKVLLYSYARSAGKSP